MKCKLCGKKGVQLGHWRNEHPDYMARKRREGAARRRTAGKGAPRAERTRGRSRTRRAVAGPPEAPVGVPASYFCPGCGHALYHSCGCNPCGGRR